MCWGKFPHERFSAALVWTLPKPGSGLPGYQLNWFPKRTVEFGEDRNLSRIVDITGIGPTLATACIEAGFACVDSIAGATANELATVPGIGELRAQTLISAAQSLLNGADQAEARGAARPGAEKTKKRIKNKDKDKDKDKKSKKQKKKNKKKSKKKKSKSGKKKQS
jgi:colicin import membrane protein